MRAFCPSRPPARRPSTGSSAPEFSLDGIVTASRYFVASTEIVTLTYEDTSIDGIVTASTYLTSSGNIVNLEFDPVANTYQWIDEDGDNIVGETTNETDWTATALEQPPRIRVTNPSTGQSRIFVVNQPIVVTHFDFFVDSVNGDDANPGTTINSPLRTLSAAQSALSDNQSLGLARGSYWREQFDVPTNGLSIGVYGTGAMPIIDGAEEITATWTQPDIGLYPDVWSVSWTRAQAATTGVAAIGIWINGEFPSRYATTLTDLQANGGYNANTLISTTTTLSIKSDTNPNSNGMLYEAAFRRYGINAHSTTRIGGEVLDNDIEGPIEIKRAIDHYNGHTGGRGTTKRLLILDGNVHHTVTEGSLTEDCLYSGVVPGRTSGTAVAYTAISSSTLAHVFRRCLVVFPGGSSRNRDHAAFYSHGTTTVASLTVEQCVTRAASLGGADALAVVIRNCYTEECVTPTAQAVSTNLTFDVERVIARDLTQISDIGGNIFFRRFLGSAAITINNCGCYILSGAAINFTGSTGTRPLLTNSVIYGNGITGNGFMDVNHCVIDTNDIAYVASSIVTDYNIFYRRASSIIRASIGGTLYQSLAAWQAATSQDTNSVLCKSPDQVRGNPLALYLGVANDENNGPADGDWRINPGARVYSGADAPLIGTFADGTTPLTAAGIQEHWNFNSRSIVAGPPTRVPVFPATIAEMRDYVDDPAAWNFYP